MAATGFPYNLAITMNDYFPLLPLTRFQQSMVCVTCTFKSRERLRSPAELIGSIRMTCLVHLCVRALRSDLGRTGGSAMRTAC